MDECGVLTIVSYGVNGDFAEMSTCTEPGPCNKVKITKGNNGIQDYKFTIDVTMSDQQTLTIPYEVLIKNNCERAGLNTKVAVTNPFSNGGSFENKPSVYGPTKLFDGDITTMYHSNSNTDP